MRQLLTLLLLLLLPATAFSQANYDLSCENVANIRIMHIIDTPWDAKSESSHFYVVRIDLKPSATDLFGRLVKDASTIFIDQNGVGHARRELAFTANGALLRTDTPDLTGFDKYGVTLGTSREQEAVDTARLICPALVPQWEELGHANHAAPPMGAWSSSASAGLTFDISCENITNIIIVRGDDQFLKQHTTQGFVHSVTFFLKPEVMDAFQEFVDASRQAQRSRDAEGAHPYVALSITANGEPLRNDILEIRGYSGTKVCTFILLEEDALAAARSVCPALVPSEIFKVGKWE